MGRRKRRRETKRASSMGQRVEIMYYVYYVWDEEHQVTIEEERWVAYYVRVEGLKSCIRNYFLFNLFMIIKYNNKNNKIKKNKYK